MMRTAMFGLSLTERPNPMRIALLLLLAICSRPAIGQTSLQPGYDNAEGIEMLKLAGNFVDTVVPDMQVPRSQRFRPVYRSPELGLQNQWELLTDGEGTAVISLRGTANTGVSWLENGYAAMTPATGSMQLDEGAPFRFDLADDHRAAVHVGWLLGTGFLWRDIRPKIDSLYAAGTRDVLITGHSQGGALCYLLTAHINRLQHAGELPADLRFKSYALAAPKPGNAFFAYSYEYNTRGWAFNVINAWDWVPEAPVSIQTMADFNAISPFANAEKVIRTFPFSQRLVLKHVYNKLDGPTRKAQRSYMKYLGGTAGKQVRKVLPHYVEPPFATTNLYVRTGTIITILPDSAYAVHYPQDPKRPFVNHTLGAYLYLLERYNTDARAEATTQQEPVQGELQQGSARLRAAKTQAGVLFYALGQEPGWALDISKEKGLVLRTQEGELFTAPYAEPAQAQDADVQRYRSVGTEGELIAHVLRKPCSDPMSGEAFTHEVSVQYTVAGSARTFTGCGMFLPPIRLHDIWMLRAVNDTLLDVAGTGPVPRLEFHVADLSVTGTTGCNSLSGMFEATANGLVLDRVATTMMLCEGAAGAMERRFMPLLNGTEYTISFKGNDLFLTNAAGKRFTFRRVD